MTGRWRDIVKIEVFDDEDPTKWMDDYHRDKGKSRLNTKEEQEIARSEEASKFLEEDVENVLRELEEFQGSGMGQMNTSAADFTDDMEALSNALGKVSALLQDWI